METGRTTSERAAVDGEAVGGDAAHKTAATRSRARPAAATRHGAQRAAVAAALAALVALSAGCLGHTGGGKVPPGAKLVQIYHMAFRPRIVTVTAGQTVTWRFEDAQVEHNVDSRTGGFESPDQDSGTWSHTFSTPGTYGYFCGIHTYMTGAVVVLPAHP